MAKLVDLSGHKYNKLLVVERRGADNLGHTLWLCKCDCGNYKICRGDKVKTGRIKSCGCNNLQKYHGLSNHRLYKIWSGMKDRCYNKKVAHYKHYGARGIRICDAWLTDFMSFYVWSREHNYQEDLTIDRIDVNGDYEPDNCRWITILEQQHNKTNSVILEYNGRSLCISEWARLLNVSPSTLYARYHRGLPIEEILKEGGSTC